MRMGQGSPNLLLSVFLSSGDCELQGCHHDALEQAAKGEGKISAAPLTLPVLLFHPLCRSRESPGRLVLGLGISLEALSLLELDFLTEDL